MIGISVKVLKNEFPGMGAKVRQRAGQVSEQSAKRIEADARQRAPRDTGHLQDDSIHAIKVSVFTWIVNASTEDDEHSEYAPFVEHGVQGQPAQPFLTPAAEAERSKFFDALDKILDGLV